MSKVTLNNPKGSVFPTEGPLSIEIFDETGELRASGMVPAYTDICRWLDAAPFPRSGEERAAVRVEGPDRDGCWIYLGIPNDIGDGWIHGPALRRLRTRIMERAAAL